MSVRNESELDLVDEMQWEDSDKVEFITLEEAGLENENSPTDECFKSSICSYLEWFYDGDSGLEE
jgi:hypothetical protein